MPAAFAISMLRRPLRLTLAFSALLPAVPLPGCSFMNRQVGYTSSMTCMNRECGDEQGVARTQCEKECSERYGR
jgi:hypothetical protein